MRVRIAALVAFSLPTVVGQQPAVVVPTDLLWSTPSADSSGAMPIGNGELGAMVWMHADGTLHLLLSRTDSFSECSRLLKLGELRLRLPAVAADEPFAQRLRLADGTIAIDYGRGEHAVSLRIVVDSDAAVVHVEGTAPAAVVCECASWRLRADSAPRRLTGDELQSCWTMRDAPADVVVAESADMVVRRELPNLAVGVRHHAATSLVAFTAARQGLEPAAVEDPLLRRTFGVLCSAPDATAAAPTADGSPALQLPRTFSLRAAAPCLQVRANAAEWDEAAAALLAATDTATARVRTVAWWRAFWQRSWIAADLGGKAIDADGDCSRLTQALALQRWVQACGGRGNWPIKFNGSIFTVEPIAVLDPAAARARAARGRHRGPRWESCWGPARTRLLARREESRDCGPGGTNGAPSDPDWRKWGDCYWWQNTRLSYYPMLAQGDLEMLEPLFRLYRRTLPAAEHRVRRWYGDDAAGAWWPETMTPFGLHGNGDYGWQRDGQPANKVLCPWWEYARNQGLELVALMLDRCDYAPDAAFVRDELLMVAVPVLAWFAHGYPRGDDGRLRIEPTQSLETYWYGVRDDMPTVAGLHDVLPRLLALAQRLPEACSAAPLDDWRQLHAALPPVPVHEVDGVKLLAPAGAFDPRRSNCENPELYAVFPFRLFGLFGDDLELARATFRQRRERIGNGWPQDGQQAALLGLGGDARDNLLARIANQHAAHRFPAMWGPNFDWLPDQCHGGNLLDTAARMLVQAHGDRIWLLPAWPLDVDVAFKLHAPGRTTIECEWRGGRMRRLVVTPAARERDVVLPSATSAR